MTLSVIRSIGTLDRTGAAQGALARLESATFDELDVARPGDLDTCDVDVDVLIVGAKELTATGLRRIGRWRRAHPASIAIAHLNGSIIDRNSLASAGIAQTVRGPLTLAKLRTALGYADAALFELLDAAERHGFEALEEPADDSAEEPLAD